MTLTDQFKKALIVISLIVLVGLITFAIESLQVRVSNLEQNQRAFAKTIVQVATPTVTPSPTATPAAQLKVLPTKKVVK